MKFKAFLLSIIVAISSLSFSNAQELPEVVEAKESIKQMIILLNENNYKELVKTYAYIPPEQKVEFLSLLEIQSLEIPQEKTDQLTTLMTEALSAKGTVVDDEVVLLLQDGTALILAKDENVWKLKD